MKFIYKGVEYPSAEWDDVDTDEVEAIEAYTGLRYSQTFDQDVLKSDIKLTKIQLWLALRRSPEGFKGSLTDLKFKMGDVEVHTDPADEAEVEKVELDPTSDAEPKDPAGDVIPSDSVSTS